MPKYDVQAMEFAYETHDPNCQQAIASLSGSCKCLRQAFVCFN
jgi:hypothetical protein